MNEQRTRQDVYYLERIKGPVTLREDGVVGEIGKVDVEVTEHLPSRIAGRERIVTKIESRMAEVAIYASLGEYLSYESQRSRDGRYQHKYEWTLDDMPQEVLAAYNAWCESVDLDINAVKALASSKVVSDQERQTTTMACKDCDHTSKYLCRTSGSAKEFYTYPIARYQDGDVVYDVPFDIADVINRSPEAVSITIRPEFDAAGKMSAERLLVIKAQTIPRSYITGGVYEEVIQIAPGEALESDIEIVIDYWNEDTRLADQKRRSWAYANRFSAQTESDDTPERYLEFMQFYLAQMVYKERKDPKDYDAMLQKLHTEVGRRGLGLAYEYTSAGMGEMDARILLTKEIQGHLVTRQITYTDEVRDALERALQFIKEN